MNDLLLTVLSLSLSGSLVALLLFLLKPLLKNRLSKTWQYYLWLLVIARMLLPISPEASPTGRLFERAAFPPVRQEATLPLGEAAPSAPLEASPTPEAQEHLKTAAPPDASIFRRETAEKGLSAQELLALLLNNLWAVWLAGALFLLTKKVVAYQSFLRFIRAGRREVAGREVRDVYLTTAAEMGVRRLPKLYTHPMASTPMQIGVLHPFIVLPEKLAEGEALVYVLRHELAHCRRMETLYKWAVQFTVCVHWFNPLIYVVAREVDRACELACDEVVLRRLDQEERRAYGSLLLSTAALEAGYSSGVVSVALCENGKHLKERLGAILQFGKKRKLWVVLGAVLTVAIFCGAGYLGAYTATRAVLLSIAPPALNVLPGNAIPASGETRHNGHHYGWDDDEGDWEDFADSWLDFGMDWNANRGNGYEYKGDLSGKMQLQVDQSLPAEGVELVKLRMNALDVTIRPSDNGEIRLVCMAEWQMAEDEKPALVREGNTLLLDTMQLKIPYYNYGWENSRVQLRREVILYLPAGYDKGLEAMLDASDLKAEQPLKLTSLEVTANASDVLLQELACEAFELDMNASDLVVKRLTGAGILRNNASDAQLYGVRPSGAMELQSNAADLLVEYEKDAAFSFEGSWSYGELDTDFSLEKRESGHNGCGSGSASLNGGGPLLNVRCSSGDAIIYAAN